MSSPTITISAPSAADTAENLLRLLPGQLHDSPFNPRTAYTAVQELADSIRAAGGVLQPLLVRPRLPNPLRTDWQPEDGYEIVCGHRRRRAAVLAGVDLPCVVRTLSDAQACMAQMIENVEREDLQPLEEAEGIRRLVEDHGMKVEAVAHDLGRSKRHIYNRLALLKLHPDVKAALQAGKLQLETVQAIARVQGERNQLAALKVALEHAWQDRRGYRTVVQELNERFTLDLKAAIFDTTDATLLPGAGPCASCPKLSGNAPELFEDLVSKKRSEDYGPGRIYLRHDGERVCTDPDCFAEKKKAHLARVAEAEKAKGATVVTGNAAKAAIGADGKLKGDYVPVAMAKAALKGTGQKPVVVTIVDQRSGETVQAVKRPAQAKGATATGMGSGTSKATRREDHEAQRRAMQEKAELATEENQAIFNRLCDAMLEQPRTTEDLRAVIVYLLDVSDLDPSVAHAVAHKHGLHHLADLRDALPTMGADTLGRVLLQLVVGTCVEVQYWQADEAARTCAPLYNMAARYGVDPQAVRGELRMAREPAEGASTPSPAARAATGGDDNAAAATAAFLAAHKPATLGPGVAAAVLAAAETGGRKPKPGKKAAKAAGSAGKSQKDEARCAGQEQTDDAGCAGGGGGQGGDMFEQAAR